MRAFVEALCRLMARAFFRRVDVVGRGRVPSEGPLLIVANHPNGLMDPLVLLTQSPRPVSFMSKEPLFRTPVVSVFVKALDCLPIYRKQDGADTGANRRTMEAARTILGRGGAIAIFPEGISHDKPQLQPLKTGAARMGLATQRLIADAGDSAPLRIQPVGLYFEDKSTFRSEAVVVWGEPLDIPVVDIDDEAEPGREDTHALTERLAVQMRALTPDAPESGQVAMAARLARLLVAFEIESEGESVGKGIGRRLEIMQRLLAGHAQADSGRVRAIVEKIERHERDLSYWRLSPDLASQPSRVGAARSLVGTLLVMLLLSPLSLVGIVMNYPVYRLIGWAAKRFSKGQNDVVSTVKILGGLVLFPAGWAIGSAAVGPYFGLFPALWLLILSPLFAWAALHWLDHLDALASARRALMMLVKRRALHSTLLQEQREIREELNLIEEGLLAKQSPIEGTAVHE